MRGDQFGGRWGERSVVVEPVGRDDPALAVVRHCLAKGIVRLAEAEPIAREGSDPEGVHQARVAARRMRSDLATFKPLLDREWTTALRSELKWLGGELGAVRDLDVLRAHLERAAQGLDEHDRQHLPGVLHDFDGRWNDARAALDEVFRGSRYHSLRDDLVAAAHAPVVTPAALEPARRAIPPLIEKAWNRLERAVGALGPDPSDEELHAVRIEAKRARYAVEAVADAFGRRATELGKAIAQVQDVLGDHNDAVVAQEWLRGHAVGQPAEVAYALGIVGGYFRREQARTREEFAGVWAAASRPKLRRWL